VSLIKSNVCDIDHVIVCTDSQMFFLQYTHYAL